MGLFNPLLHLRGVYMHGAIQSLVTLKRGVCMGLFNPLLHLRGVYVLYTVYIYFIIEVCPAGYFGRNCSDLCTYPYYGNRCDEKCNCSKERFKYLYNIQ